MRLRLPLARKGEALAARGRAWFRSEGPDSPASSPFPERLKLTFDEARSRTNCYVVAEADWGGQILFTIPARQVRCGEPALIDLIRELSLFEWGTQDAWGLRYELRFPPSGVSGGMGGGLALDDLWLHKTLSDVDVRQPIQAVLSGSRAPSELFREAFSAIGPAFAPRAKNPKKLRNGLAFVFYRMGWLVLRVPLSRERGFDGFGVVCSEHNSGRVLHGRCAVVDVELAPQVNAVLAEVNRWLGEKDAKPPLVAVFTTLPTAAIPDREIASADSRGVGIVPAESLQSLLALVDARPTPSQVVEALRSGFARPR